MNFQSSRPPQSAVRDLEYPRSSPFREAKIMTLRAQEDAEFAEEKLASKDQELAEAKQRVRELELKLDESCQRQHKIENVIEEYEVSNNKTGVQMKEVNRRFYELQRKFAASEKDRKELVQRIIVTEKDKKTVTERWIRATAQLKQGEKHLRSQSGNRSGAETSKASDRDQDSSNPRIEALLRELEQSRSALETKEETIRDQTESIKSLHKDFVGKNAELDQARSALSAFQAETADVRAQYAANIQSLSEQISTLESQNEELRSTLASYHKHDEELAQKSNEVTRLGKEMEVERSLRGKIEAEYKAIADELAKERSVVSELKSRRDACEAGLKAEREKVLHLEAEAKKARSATTTATATTAAAVPLGQKDENIAEAIKELQRALSPDEGSSSSGLNSRLVQIEKYVRKLAEERLRADEKYDRLLRKYYNVCEGPAANSYKHKQTLSLVPPDSSCTVSSVAEDTVTRVSETYCATEKENAACCNMPVSCTNRVPVIARNKVMMMHRGSCANQKRSSNIHNATVTKSPTAIMSVPVSHRVSSSVASPDIRDYRRAARAQPTVMSNTKVAAALARRLASSHSSCSCVKPSFVNIRLQKEFNNY